MNDIGARIRLLFPTADLMSKVIILDDGDGPYIHTWDDSLGRQPTESELLAVDVAAERTKREKLAQYRELAILRRAKAEAEADNETDIAAEFQSRIDAEVTRVSL